MMTNKPRTKIRPLKYNDYQNERLAIAAIDSLSRKWFSVLGEATPDLFMARLLLSVYHFYMMKSSVHKKHAWMLMGLEDIKTARKYVALAERLELIEVITSTEDRRKQLLLPTDLLRQLVEHELRSFASGLRISMYHLLESPLPATGDPYLIRDGHWPPNEHAFSHEAQIKPSRELRKVVERTRVAYEEDKEKRSNARLQAKGFGTRPSRTSTDRK